MSSSLPFDCILSFLSLVHPCIDAGVVGGCSDLCGLLAKKTGNKIVGDVCELLCVYVGIKEFIKVLEE